MLKGIEALTADHESETGVHGVAEISFSKRMGRTALNHLYQGDPLRVLFPLTKSRELSTAVVVNTSGGLVGGDRLDLTLSTGAQSSAVFTTQAAEKVYRSIGADCRVTTRITLHADSWMEWLPLESILFEGARLRRQSYINLTSGARIMAGEIFVFGRHARGERLTRGLVRDAWEVRYDDRLLWADALHLDGNLKAILENPACFNGCRAYAMMIYVAEDAPLRLDLARRLIPAEGVLSGATSIGKVLVVRWLAREASALRCAYGKFWASFRKAVADLPPELPRIWYV
jgi:urease accessory protein